jgi:flagellar export protein FliJ
MRRFRFKLEAVEKIRKNREKGALRELAGAQRALQNEKQRKLELESLLHQAHQRRVDLSHATTTREDLAVEDNFIQGTKLRIRHTEMAITRATRQVEKCIAFYLHCRKEWKMIDKLREKALQDFKEQERKREAKALDDLYIMRRTLEEEGNAA